MYNNIRNNCLHLYQNKNDFCNFVKEKGFDKWEIMDLDCEYRSRFIYWNTIQLADDSGYYPKEEEMVSWQDTWSILYNVFQREDFRSDWSIIQEYRIPSCERRVDYLLVKGNKILVIEFGMDAFCSDSFLDEKQKQANNYKALLEQLIPNIEIETFVFLYNEKTYASGWGTDGFVHFVDNFFASCTSAIDGLDRLVQGKVARRPSTAIEVAADSVDYPKPFIGMKVKCRTGASGTVSDIIGEQYFDVTLRNGSIMHFAHPHAFSRHFLTEIKEKE